MRIPRPVLTVLFPAFLCYYAAVAHASLPGHGLAARPAPLSELGRVLSHVALPASVTNTVSETASRLRETVMASGLMTDTRPNAEEARRDFVALWADLEPSRTAVEAASPALDTPGSPVLVPGQD